MENQRPLPFSLFESFAGGFRLFWQHWQIFVKLSYVPFALTLLTLVVMRSLNESLTLFWLPIIQLPSSFVTGLQMALILRYLMLQEHPLGVEGEARRARNLCIAHSALAYAAITYFVTGMYAGLLEMQKFLNDNPEAAAPYLPVGAAALAGLLWGARWFWLHVPIALDWPVKAFYQQVGGWTGSLKIFALFGMCSLSLNFVAGLLRSIVHALFGKMNGGFIAAFDDAVVAASTMTLTLLFTCASVVAIQSMMQGKKA